MKKEKTVKTYQRRTKTGKIEKLRKQTGKKVTQSDDMAAEKAFMKLPKPAKGSKDYAVHMALRSVVRAGAGSDDTIRDALVRNGYPEDKAYSKGVKEVIAFAKKHKILL